ncbi:uncharacterized protein LOC143373685 [Andrena cerasifolii]|uniref:uncharacterized protein LOC143373685 n=1 Tax=Andrena cerasifolii TaxID=2819439 RepID=UPI004037CBB2
MFKLAVFAAILAVAVAAPGGLPSIRGIGDLGLGPIQAPVITSHAVSLPAAHVAVQAIAPLVHTAPIVTKNVLTAAPLPLLSAAGHGWH